MLDGILTAFRVISFVFCLVVTVYVVATYKRLREVKFINKSLSIVFTALMLLVFMDITGTRMHWTVRIPVLVLGFVMGFIRGWFIRFRVEHGKVLIQLAPLFLLGWGISFLLAQAVAGLDARVATFFCTLPFVFSTGTQLGIDTNLVLRRLFYKLPVGGPAA